MPLVARGASKPPTSLFKIPHSEHSAPNHTTTRVTTKPSQWTPGVDSPCTFSWSSGSSGAGKGKDRAPRRVLSTGMDTGRACRLRGARRSTPVGSRGASDNESLESTTSWRPSLLFFLPLAGALAERRRIRSPRERFRTGWGVPSVAPVRGVRLNSSFRPCSWRLWKHADERLRGCSERARSAATRDSSVALYTGA